MRKINIYRFIPQNCKCSRKLCCATFSHRTDLSNSKSRPTVYNAIAKEVCLIYKIIYFHLLLFVACFALDACTSLPQSAHQKDLSDAALNSEVDAYERDPHTLYPIVLKEATELEGKVIDGWFFGSDSRSLKSGYTKSTSALKAQFACDYMQMLLEHHQDLVKNWQSYVPYSQREKFARAWWSDPKHSTAFVDEPYYKKILWLHEALMDASELWWRALERQCPDGVPSTQALAHDSEQQMVSNFKEDEHSPDRSVSSFARPPGEDLQKEKIRLKEKAEKEKEMKKEEAK